MATPIVRSPRPRVSRADQVSANRRRLLDAAGRVFRELGYAGASLDAIAQVAGFSKGAVYSHFTSKADLFLSLLEDRIARRAESELAAAASTPVGGGLETFLAEVFEVARADPQWHLALLEFRVVAARDPALNARYAAAHQRTIDGIVEALRAWHGGVGVEPATSLDTLARAGLALDAGGFLEDVVAPGGLPSVEIARLFTRLIGLPAPATHPEDDRR